MHCKQQHILEFIIVAGAAVLLAVPTISLVLILWSKKSEESSYKKLKQCTLIFLIPLVILVLLGVACHLIYSVITIVLFASHDFDVGKLKCRRVHVVTALAMIICTLVIIIGTLGFAAVIFCVRCVCCRPQRTSASRAIT